uniref:W2 domain-containing protein n=1 Tax=Macrostomum lignano TaxID=282301 RepID=A0A1I8FMT2_9PLAT
MAYWCNWSRAGNPPNALLRAFMAVYDLDICDEETIVRWKEEVNHAYPDKGKALFQLNKFLNWLDQAEEESDEEAGVRK